jgi:hypothetical protein
VIAVDGVIYLMASSLPTTYISVKQATLKYGLSEKCLLERVKSGSIASGRLPNGELLVAENDIDPSLMIKREDFEHLRGNQIIIVAASRNYSDVRIQIPPSSFSYWAKMNRITVLDRRRGKVMLDEADVAYCAAVYRAKYEFYDGQMNGVAIFDKDGNPCQMKYREVAVLKRAERRRRQEQQMPPD